MGKADAGNHKPRKRGTFRSVFSGIVFTIPCQRRGRIAMRPVGRFEIWGLLAPKPLGRGMIPLHPR